VAVLPPDVFDAEGRSADRDAPAHVGGDGAGLGGRPRGWVGVDGGSGRGLAGRPVGRWTAGGGGSASSRSWMPPRERTHAGWSDDAPPPAPRFDRDRDQVARASHPAPSAMAVSMPSVADGQRQWQRSTLKHSPNFSLTMARPGSMGAARADVVRRMRSSTRSWPATASASRSRRCHRASRVSLPDCSASSSSALTPCHRSRLPPGPVDGLLAPVDGQTKGFDAPSRQSSPGQALDRGFSAGWGRRLWASTTRVRAVATTCRSRAVRWRLKCSSILAR
jgi:hypothetical protein